MIDNSDIPRDILEIAIGPAALKPSNMPSDEQINKWDMMVGRDFNRTDDKGNILIPMVRFEPTNLFPETDVVQNTIKYRFHVRKKCGQIVDKKNIPTEFPRIIGDELIDVEHFLKTHKPA